MENTTPEHNFPLLEQSSNAPQHRIISYAIYANSSAMYRDYKYVLFKYVSFPPSIVIQRDESFNMLFNDLETICNEISMQGFAMFMPHPDDPPGLVRSFI